MDTFTLTGIVVGFIAALLVAHALVQAFFES
jgi:hypothetical protein